LAWWAGHSLEFSIRHSRVEAGAGSDLRQHGGAEAGIGRPLSAWRIVEALHEAGVPKA